MPDTKITALTAIGANPIIPATFPIPMVDLTDTSMAASGTTKKVTVNQILGAGGTATLASATITGDLTVATNAFAVRSSDKKVFVGTAPISTAYSFYVTRGGTAGSIAQFTDGTAQTLTIDSAAGGLIVGNANNGYVSLTANGIEQYRIAPLGVFTWSDGAGGTRMTLNSTGLGVGISPSYKGHFYNTGASTELRIENGSTTAGFTNRLSFKSASGAADARTGAIEWYDVGTFKGDIRLLKAGGIQMRNSADVPTFNLDDTGNVGIGVTPSAWGNLKVVQFSGGSSIGGGFNSNWIQANAYYDGADWRYIATAAATRLQHDNAFKFFTAPSGTAGNAITFTQAMTLDASGNLLLGKTVNSITTVGFQSTATGEVSAALAASTNAATQWTTYSTGAAAYRFYVGMGGTVFATNTTISAISDSRLKENVQDLDVGLNEILALKPRKFDWKAGKGKDIKGDRGFIAQEFETVFPNLIDEWKDNAPEGEAPYKSVRQDLIPVLVKAIQELTARVQTLEAK